jgi:hypothetical protein
VVLALLLLLLRVCLCPAARECSGTPSSSIKHGLHAATHTHVCYSMVADKQTAAALCKVQTPLCDTTGFVLHLLVTKLTSWHSKPTMLYPILPAVSQHPAAAAALLTSKHTSL